LEKRESGKRGFNFYDKKARIFDMNIAQVVYLKEKRNKNYTPLG